MTTDTDTPSIQTLAERRADLEATLNDVGSRLANHDTHDLAGSTLSTRVSEWERGESDPTQEDLAALEAVLDAIEAEQNSEYPACIECSRTPQKEPVETADGPRCIACDYGRNGP